ncbi:dynein axonemal intermediate chain 2-like [Papilio machaon]|uniref:dynein axonemal intermediate chain 2-like n=1 Tax=Papilio machaon TaxID=76193 RepID=UPI001E665091|nr:dynein axonemal intermediate chain 2-like [Papilio machaon]
MEKPEKNEITYEYTRKRKEFGKQTLFEDYGPEMCVSIPCNPSQYKNYILRNPVHVAVQNAPNMSENWVNLTRAEYTSSGINHVESGWPKDINMNDPEATQRYRRKIEKDDAYIHAVMHLGHIYYSELPSIPPVERSSCHTVNVYREPGARRPVRSLSWQADGGAKLAVAHADIEVLNTRSLQFSYI